MSEPAPDLRVKLGALELSNPVMVASGTFGYGPEYANLVDIDRLGALVVKGIRMQPTTGNSTPRAVEVASGMINAIGLPGPGVEGFIETYIPFLETHTVPVIVNIWGCTIEEYGEVAARLDQVDRVDALELNVSCPNIKQGSTMFGTHPEMVEQVVRHVRERTRKTIIPKLAPNVADVPRFAQICEGAGADAISLINSVPAMAIDIETRRPMLANTTGGLTGPAIHPIAVKQVWEAAGAVSIPVIGMGGIVSAKEAIEFMIAGATAVAVGTANFSDPTVSLDVIDGIAEYLSRHGMRSVNELIGSIDLRKG
ncbi:MAG: dihydroorotate dehydrogenase [Verrucomicrobia bacterium]|nr:dihydroorotate dehydrogenase [Verrucomicrobiota bacterium]MDA1086296.1 dihydroorotate dehydrogenase [Verrucomicrobiota bacterium]